MRTQTPRKRQSWGKPAPTRSSGGQKSDGRRRPLALNQIFMAVSVQTLQVTEIYKRHLAFFDASLFQAVYRLHTHRAASLMADVSTVTMEHQDKLTPLQKENNP